MDQHIDIKFKDASPLKTVDKIKRLLSENGISVTEHWGEHTVKHCYSLRIVIDNTTLGTNGKGATKELTAASAYAELMERLQGEYLGFGKRIHHTDAKRVDRQTMKSLCGSYFESISQLIQYCDNKYVSPDQLLENCFEYENQDLAEVRPYYNATENTVGYLPVSLVTQLTHSTGLCAGNSPEEAIVQGFSEIMERWCQRHFLSKAIVPPTIPDSYLAQFPAAYETICDIRDHGYNVLVKDCSMGTGFPVIAVAILSKKKHAYHANFGASPVFEIALKRCLTETFQGKNIRSVTDTSLAEADNLSVGTFRKAFLSSGGAYPIDFFTEDSSYPFVPFEDRSQCSNLELLHYIVDFLKQQNMTMYVRDQSCLGFPAYKIVVPQMSDAYFGFLYSIAPIPKLTGLTQSIRLNPKQATMDQLYELQMLNAYKMNNYLVDSTPSSKAFLSLPINADHQADMTIGFSYLAYVEWECGNRKAGLEYLKTLARMNVPGISDYFSCLNRLQLMKASTDSLEKKLEKLSLFYDDAVIAKVRDVVTNHKNPFADYVVACSPDWHNCDSCKYQGICIAKQCSVIKDIVRNKVSLFDNEAAFKQLHTVFTTKA